MSDADPVFWPAHRIARAIRSRALSASDALEAYLAQIRRHNPRLNAVPTLDETGARARAADADRALARGEDWGPLHGVPITIKDTYETAGLRTTFGYPPTSACVPARDATVVARLREAGAVIMGKTNIPTAAYDWQCHNPIFGRTVNPWDPERTPGGSSGGAAAALAAGLTSLDIGSDTAGSIRVPAHFCGVFALKPSEHRVSGAGHVEIRGRPRSIRHMATYGPLARSVEDLRLALSLIAGPDGRQPEVPPVPLAAAASRAPRDRRICWTDAFDGFPVTQETRGAIERFVRRIEQAGMHVERRTPRDCDFLSALETWGEIDGAEIGPILTTLERWAFRAAMASGLAFGRSPWSRGVARGLGGNLYDYFRALTRRDGFLERMETFLAGWDAWLCPVAAVPAIRHQRTGAPIEVDGRPVAYSLACGGYASVISVTGNPVVVLPIDRSESGLPIGVQVVGRRWCDMELLDVAGELADLSRPWQPPPGF